LAFVSSWGSQIYPVAERNKYLDSRYSHKHCPIFISLLQKIRMFHVEETLETIDVMRNGRRWDPTTKTGRAHQDACTALDNTQERKHTTG